MRRWTLRVSAHSHAHRPSWRFAQRASPRQRNDLACRIPVALGHRSNKEHAALTGRDIRTQAAPSLPAAPRVGPVTRSAIDRICTREIESGHRIGISSSSPAELSGSPPTWSRLDHAQYVSRPQMISDSPRLRIASTSPPLPSRRASGRIRTEKGTSVDHSSCARRSMSFSRSFPDFLPSTVREEVVPFSVRIYPRPTPARWQEAGLLAILSGRVGSSGLRRMIA